MAVDIALGPDDLRIIGHAINWMLNAPYERTLRPQLTEEETSDLSYLFAELCSLSRACGEEAESASLVLGESYLRSGRQMSLSPESLRLMTQAVASFFSELRTSPDEIEIITGAPWKQTAELLKRLQEISADSSFERKMH